MNEPEEMKRYQWQIAEESKRLLSLRDRVNNLARSFPAGEFDQLPLQTREHILRCISTLRRYSDYRTSATFESLSGVQRYYLAVHTQHKIFSMMLDRLEELSGVKNE